MFSPRLFSVGETVMCVISLSRRDSGRPETAVPLRVPDKSATHSFWGKDSRRRESREKREQHTTNTDAPAPALVVRWHWKGDDPHSIRKKNVIHCPRLPSGLSTVQDDDPIVAIRKQLSSNNSTRSAECYCCLVCGEFSLECHFSQSAIRFELFYSLYSCSSMDCRVVIKRFDTVWHK